MPDEYDPRFIESKAGAESSRGARDSGSDEVLDQAPTPVVELLKRRRVLAGVLVVTLAVGVGLGALLGRHGAAPGPGTTATRTVVRAVTASPPAPSSGPYSQLLGTGARCSMQHGHQLQLGFEVRNELDVPVTLDGLRVPYSAGDGLRPVGTAREVCGALAGTDNGIEGFPLAVGSSVWLTVTVDVLAECPQALHLSMLVDYTIGGRRATASLDGFPDLGGVPYSGCR